MEKAYIPNITDKELLEAVATEAEKLKGADRRNFLKKGIQVTAAGAMVAAGSQIAPKTAHAVDNLPPNTPKWQKGLGRGVVEVPYGLPSKFQKHVVRRTVPWLTADPIASISFTPLAELNGIITPNGLVFERYHGGVPDVPPGEYRLMIHGMVERPLIFTLDELLRFPTENRIAFIECPANGGMEWRGTQMEAVQFTHGMVSCCEWTGVPLKVLLQEVGVKPEGKWVLAEGSDAAGMTRSVPIEKAMDDALVVFAQNGEALRPEQGYPVRLLNPGWEGNTSVKWLRRLEVGDKPWHHREETSKYTDLLADGKARRFSWEMEGNSVVTFPCPEKPLNRKGWYELRGLAWSGKGKIKKVDISFDGGVNWKSARLHEPVLSKAMTRFTTMFEWHGQEMLIQSRSKDESGYVQPTITQLRDARGVNSIYHKNSIPTWQVESNGTVNNVQIS